MAKKQNFVDVEITFTDAQTSYDSFGMRTLKDELPHPVYPGTRRVRKVATPCEHLEWQRARYESGGYIALTEQQWEDYRQPEVAD